MKVLGIRASVPVGKKEFMGFWDSQVQVSYLITLCYSAMVMTQDKSSIYCCRGEGHYGVTQYCVDPTSSKWILQVTGVSISTYIKHNGVTITHLLPPS
jgi:hypothetical protein